MGLKGPIVVGFFSGDRILPRGQSVTNCVVNFHEENYQNGHEPLRFLKTVIFFEKQKSFMHD